MQIKQSIAVIAVTLLLIASTSFVFPNNAIAIEKGTIGNYDQKDEVIYSNLTSSGQVKDMYVVNTFHVSKQGSIVDYGPYRHVRNLTNLLPIEQQNEKKIQFYADESEYYYQGELENKPLPWSVDIVYLLDGEEVSPEQLAGKSGELDIHLSTSANESVDDTFFEYYLLQVSVTLDPEIFKKVQAPKGTEVKEGKNRLISFNVMPGEAENLVVSADVESFEMEPIQITAIPANIGIDDPEFDSMKEDIQSLADAIAEIDQGIGKLKNGMTELHDGTKELKDGSQEYLSGIKQLNQSSEELIDGSTQIRAGLQQINEALSGEEMNELPTEGDIQQLTNGLRDLAQSLQQSTQGFQGLDDAIANLPDDDIDLSTLEQILADDQTEDSVRDTINSLIEVYYVTEAIKDINKQVTKPFIDSADQFSAGLLSIADEIEGSMTQLSELNKLIEGLNQLSSQYEGFHQGLIEYTNGVQQLTRSYRQVDKGIIGLAKGTNELEKGVRKLHEGSTELREETKDLPNEMQSEIDEQLAAFDYSDFEAISFVSEKNEQVGVVQFVLQTERIEMPEDDEEVEEKPKEKGIWQRFLDLFTKD